MINLRETEELYSLCTWPLYRCLLILSRLQPVLLLFLFNCPAKETFVTQVSVFGPSRKVVQRSTVQCMSRWSWSPKLFSELPWRQFSLVFYIYLPFNLYCVYSNNKVMTAHTLDGYKIAITAVSSDSDGHQCAELSKADWERKSKQHFRVLQSCICCEMSCQKRRTSEGKDGDSCVAVIENVIATRHKGTRERWNKSVLKCLWGVKRSLMCLLMPV